MIKLKGQMSKIRGQKLRGKIFFYCLLSAICSFLFLAGCKKEEKKENTASSSDLVIRINDREITLGDFQDKFKKIFLEGQETADIKEDEMKNLKMALVNQLVEGQLLLEEVKRLSLDITDVELEQEVEAIKKEYAGDGFDSTIINKYGSMDKWKEELKNKLLMNKAVDATIASKLTVNEDEAKMYYKEHLSDYKVKEQVRARMIVVKTEEEANQVRERLKSGEEFARVAQEVSLSPEGKEGGDLGFFGKGDMPKEFEDVVFSLPPGKISNVIKTVYGYHIFRVEEKRDARDMKFSDAKEEIINRLKREKSEIEFQAWMKSLKEKARIEVKEELL